MKRNLSCSFVIRDRGWWEENFKFNQFKIENQAKLIPLKKNNGSTQIEFRVSLNPLISSGQKEGQGGSPILKLRDKSQKVVELTFKKNSKRDLVIKDPSPTSIKRIELIAPWTKLRISSLVSPNLVKVSPVDRARFKWATELKAMMRFRSLWHTAKKALKQAPKRNQINPILGPPHFITTQKPKTPIFNKTPAKTILPNVGLSTWALGSHKWTPKTGIFTINIIPKKRALTHLTLILVLSEPNLQPL